MTAQIGLFSLMLAWGFALLLIVVPTIGLYTNNHYYKQSAYSFVVGQTAFIALAFLALVICFLQDDFTVAYVLSNSSTILPWFYKACAVWGGHEGSMLLWVFILNVWTLMVAYCSQSLPESLRLRVLVVLGVLSASFILFIVTTSNPFLRVFELHETQGHDLNPLLQDLGFLFHPPMLYMGYVGFSIPFAFAIAILWLGKMDAKWVKWTRPWTLGAWCCLTLGITLGSWWAYRELGWGGWWFWDPVENASFMPWLTGTALIHSLAVAEKRAQFKSWTLLLAITAFSLSLIGTFLVRSGILTSVHAFAVDPGRGLFILCLLFLVIGGSLFLFALRQSELLVTVKPSFMSRESFLLLNNIFLVSAMLTVLTGTLYPLLIDSLSLGKLSVGAPYFNLVFVPLMIPLLIFMGFGIHLRWKKDNGIQLLLKLRKDIALSLLIPLLLLFIFESVLDMRAYLGTVCAAWIVCSTFQYMCNAIRTKGLRNIALPFWGLFFAHMGVAVTVIGIAMSTGYGREDDVRMAVGDTYVLNLKSTLGLKEYPIRFLHEKSLTGENYHGTETVFEIAGHKKIYPQKRIYDVGKQVMTEAAIDVTAFRDVYIALGQPLAAGVWSIRIYYKPFIRWIWGGGLLILAGGILAMLDPRYFKKKKECV